MEKIIGHYTKTQLENIKQDAIRGYKQKVIDAIDKFVASPSEANMIKKQLRLK